MSLDILELQIQYQKILNTKLNKIQRDYDNSIYTDKTPLDKLTCQLCNGRYTRSQRSRHNVTKKHQAKLKEVYDQFIIKKSEPSKIKN